MIEEGEPRIVKIRADSRFAHLNEKRGENISLFNIHNQNAK